MTATTEKLRQQIESLDDIEKLRLVDAILADLDKLDPEIDRIWAEEARKRWAAYKAGRVRTVSYEELMSKHRDPTDENPISGNRAARSERCRRVVQ